MANHKTVVRPLSPHLQIYRPMLTMMMSIMHRITGIILYSGMILLVAWLVAASSSEAGFGVMQSLFGHWLGKIVLLGFTWALLHHMLGGLRHLLWDTGRGYELPVVEWLARANLAGSILLTIAVWVISSGVLT